MVKKTELEPVKKYYTLGCCGIDCGLCPRFYTEGDSKCPGCFGMKFSEKHPSCFFATCCVKKHKLEVCGQCTEFPCEKYNNKKIDKNSFVTHKKMLENQRCIQKDGIKKYIEEQNIRIKMLKKMLQEYNDGKNKSYFCIAARLLDIQNLNEAITKTANQINFENILEDDLKNKCRILKSILIEYAKEKNIKLELMK